MEKKIVKRKAYVDTSYCVACGVCENICPFEAITINKGIFSKVDYDKCVGCGKCAKVCPSSTIEIRQLGGN
jgi:heterodisulfide reductase subunit A-like polyferredoxin